MGDLILTPEQADVLRAVLEASEEMWGAVEKAINTAGFENASAAFDDLKNKAFNG